MEVSRSVIIIFLSIAKKASIKINPFVFKTPGLLENYRRERRIAINTIKRIKTRLTAAIIHIILFPPNVNPVEVDSLIKTSTSCVSSCPADPTCKRNDSEPDTSELILNFSVTVSDLPGASVTTLFDIEFN